MITLARFKNDDILPYIGTGMPKVLLNTHKYGELFFKASSTRLECLKRSQDCVRCGIKGTEWHLETHIQKTPRVGMNCFIDKCPWCALTRKKMPAGMQTPHLNLYGFSRRGRRILMTQDHIFPKHAGGSNGIENLQTMCTCCNSYKGGMLPGEYLETMNERERSRHFRSMDGRGPEFGGLSSLHAPTNEQECSTECAAE